MLSQNSFILLVRTGIKLTSLLTLLFLQGQCDRSHSWLLQPSFEVKHLLLTQSDVDVVWRMANKFYFKNIATYKTLEKICLNFHKDLQLIEVCILG